MISINRGNTPCTLSLSQSSTINLPQPSTKSQERLPRSSSISKSLFNSILSVTSAIRGTTLTLPMIIALMTRQLPLRVVLQPEVHLEVLLQVVHLVEVLLQVELLPMLSQKTPRVRLTLMLQLLLQPPQPLLLPTNSVAEVEESRCINQPSITLRMI